MIKAKLFLEEISQLIFSIDGFGLEQIGKQVELIIKEGI